MSVQIAGVASTPFGERPDSSTRELFTDAALEKPSFSVRDLGERVDRRETVTVDVEQ